MTKLDWLARMLQPAQYSPARPGIAYRLDSLDIWRPGPAGLLEQISLIVGYIWLVVIARHYLRRSHAQ